jgi:hypothetical protein
MEEGEQATSSSGSFCLGFFRGWMTEPTKNRSCFFDKTRRGYPQGISRGSSSHFYVWRFKTLSPASRIVCRHGSPNNHMLVVFSNNVHRYYITHTYIYTYVGKWWERLDQTWETIGTYADLLYQHTARNGHIKIQPFNKTIIEIMLDLAISSSRTASSTCGPILMFLEMCMGQRSRTPPDGLCLSM